MHAMYHFDVMCTCTWTGGEPAVRIAFYSEIVRNRIPQDLMAMFLWALNAMAIACVIWGSPSIARWFRLSGNRVTFKYLMHSISTNKTKRCSSDTRFRRLPTKDDDDRSQNEMTMTWHKPKHRYDNTPTTPTIRTIKCYTFFFLSLPCPPNCNLINKTTQRKCQMKLLEYNTGVQRQRKNIGP